MKTVVTDFSTYDVISGIGEIARNFCPRLAAMHMPDIHFVFILPERHCGEFGDHIDYIATEHFKQEAKPYKDIADLWHLTDQYSRNRLFGKKSIQLLTVHDLNFLHEKHGIHLWKHKILFPMFVKRSDAVTVISHYVKNDVQEHIRGLKCEPKVIYNGINDIEKNPQQKPSFITNENEKFMFTLGQVRRKKNFHVLVPMMKYLPNFKLYICGEHRWDYYNDIIAQIDDSIRDRIILPGKLTDTEKNWMYAHACAFLFPSMLEGFGIPVLEAMRFGTKVFSSRYSSLPEVCSIHASYWDNYEPEAMAEVVKKGLEGWSRDGQTAQEAAAYSRSFNYERYTKEYVALYRQLLGLPPLT